MSVQISYKKQTLFGFLLLLCLLSVIEISMRVYDHYAPNCQFIESEVFGEMSFELKRQICNDNDKLVWNNNPLYLIPNQHFSTININSHGFRGDELQNNPDYRIFVMGGSTAFGVGGSVGGVVGEAEIVHREHQFRHICNKKYQKILTNTISR